ncbi:uncharacterized protein J4E84_002179 [Alternaria hordeiaustralica]|uniref:uncharacterized protein n=1 Tax=Alternaria hordeiaustralica TaxID=1187925 RepID=UPI0020C575C7|nr:uncharacterized protein J4E84_002179 [Alternaria hordeiaustralica]KAI4695552.1 hypothetical protein J4E84_002179 [Alternaria hordeiaustralica]
MSGNESHNGEGLQSILHLGNERILSLPNTQLAEDTMGAFSAFVTRRMDPEAAENSGLRRWRRRANTVAGGKFVPCGKTWKGSDADMASRKGQHGHDVKESWAKRAAKGLWERVHNRDGRSKDVEMTGTALRLEPDNNLSTGVRTQLLISAPVASPIPAQYTQQQQRPETQSSSPIADTISSSTTVTTTHFGSPLTRVPHHTHARSATPDWIPASTSPRVSEGSTVIESPLGSDLSFDPYHELVNSIERFHFALLVNSSTIDDICGDVRDVLEISSNNLLTVGCDLQRLLVIWRELTGNAANVAVLEALEPCALVSKKHLAKACLDMKKGLQSYRDWSDMVARNKMIAQSQNAISHEWRAALNDKMKALDVLEALDFDDVAAQVELVMRKYIGAEEEANGTSNPGFLRPAIADAQTEHDANTTRVPTPQPVRDKLAVGVDHGRDPSPNTHDMAVRMDEIRARMSRMTADMKARKLARENVAGCELTVEATQDGRTKAREEADAQEG